MNTLAQTSSKSGGLSLSGWVTLIGLVALAILPLIAHFSGHSFYLDIATRLVCLSIVVASLNLILGYGGMISFGHAAYVGIGAYSVGIPAYYGIHDGWVHLLSAVLVSALFALATGAIALRTKGVYFIMITMAFAQMVFFVFVSIEEYGADDGLVIEQRSEFPFLNLEDNLTLFIFCYVILLAVLYFVHRVVNSRFGMVIRGAKGNENRMRAIGYNVYIYKLTCYVIAGAIAGLAGALLGNFTSFISPEMMDWTRSGELIFMIILGGTSTIFGPVMGTALFLILEEILSALTIYWHLIFGIILILTVLFAKGGVMGFLNDWGRKND